MVTMCRGSNPNTQSSTTQQLKCRAKHNCVRTQHSNNPSTYLHAKLDQYTACPPHSRSEVLFTASAISTLEGSLLPGNLLPCESF
eukprot:988916-Prorocentrum_minimum.AAC.3